MTQSLLLQSRIVIFGYRGGREGVQNDIPQEIFEKKVQGR